MLSDRELTSEKIAALQTFVSNNDILLMGITGVGKTTLAEHMQRIVGLRYISLGNITRAEIKYYRNAYVAELMREGGVWPFEAVSGLLKPYIEISTPYVLDGIPKHEHEAEWLVKQASNRIWPMIAVILRVSVSTAENRRLESLKYGQRPETPDQIKDRIDSFVKKEEILMQILSSVLGGVIELDVNGITPGNTVDILSEKLMLSGKANG